LDFEKNVFEICSDSKKGEKKKKKELQYLPECETTLFAPAHYAKA
jgi:hypothetical protein